MTRTQPSLADQEVIRLASERGVEISHSQLERWRSHGLIPRHQRKWLGKGRGSASSLDVGIVELIVAAGRFSRKGQSLNELTLKIFTGEAKISLPEAIVKDALIWYARNRMGGIIRYVHENTRNITDDEEKEDVAAEATATYTSTVKRGIRSKLSRLPRWANSIDLAMYAVLGTGSLGSDRLAEAINSSLGGDNTSLEYLRSHMRKLDFTETPQGPPPGILVDPEMQCAAIMSHKYDTIKRARNAITCTFHGVALLNACAQVAPDHEVVHAAEKVIASSIIVRGFSPLISLDFLRDPSLWDVYSKNIVMTLTTVGPIGEWERVGIELCDILYGRARTILRKSQ